MPTISELLDWCKFQVRHGKGEKHTNHVVVIEDEAERRTKNPADDAGRRKTRIVWDAGDADTYAVFHRERERYMKAAGANPVLATEAMAMALRVQSDELIHRFVEALQSVKAEESEARQP